VSNVRTVGVFAGSLRSGSFSGRIADALVALAPVSLTLTRVEIGALPLYNQDLDTETPPATWVGFRERVRGLGAVLFVTPEYNRSVPAALKNALDVGSRPFGKNVWDRKPGAVVSVSPGSLGAFGANHHLRQVLVYLNVPTMQQPEAYWGHVAKAWDETGSLTPIMRELCQGFLASFAAWIELVGRG